MISQLRFFTASACMVLSLAVAGCVGPQLARYDHRTYELLTFIKPEILAVYDTFAAKSIPEEKVAAAGLKLAQIREYEAGKGEANADMTRQVDSVNTMYKKHVLERRRDGPWNDANLENHKEAISEVLDIAIKTEQALNK